MITECAQWHLFCNLTHVDAVDTGGSSAHLSKQFCTFLVDVPKRSVTFKISVAPGWEYGVNICKDMAAIVSNLLDAGCSFDSPELVKRGFEPTIYMSTDTIPDDCVIKARGLPWQASDQDIAKFFRYVC